MAHFRIKFATRFATKFTESVDRFADRWRIGLMDTNTLAASYDSGAR
jgi:hypothetical protein